MTFNSKFGVKPQSGTNTRSVGAERRRFFPSLRGGGDAQYIDSRFIRILYRRLWKAIKVEMTMEVDQCMSPQSER